MSACLGCLTRCEGDLVWTGQEDLAVEAHAGQQILLKQDYVLLLQTKVVVAREELTCRLLRMLTCHYVPENK